MYDTKAMFFKGLGYFFLLLTSFDGIIKTREANFVKTQLVSFLLWTFMVNKLIVIYCSKL